MRFFLGKFVEALCLTYAQTTKKYVFSLRINAPYKNSPMKKHLFILLTSSLCLFISPSYAQSFKKSVKKFQAKLNEDYLNPETSPLPDKERKTFKGHDFFSPNKKFCIEAKFIRTPNTTPFKMETTTSRLPVYEKYGEAHFEIDGKKYVLNIYQNHQLRKTAEYKNYLFLPFKDETNGAETYGGGRFIDLKIPKGETIVIDFNKAYNPYCAYSDQYSCPVPPKENHLAVKILAGVKNYEGGH
jgi:uncharacterized protein (DUF1684 family)